MSVRAVMISIQPQWCALIANGKKTLEILSNLVKTIKRVAELAGFEVVGRIALKHKVTGKEYR